MTLANAIHKAQKSADRWQTPFAVLDINPFYAAVFVVRIWDERYVNNPDMVQRCTRSSTEDKMKLAGNHKSDTFGKAHVSITLTGQEWFAFFAKLEGKPLTEKGYKLYTTASNRISQQLIRASNNYRKGSNPDSICPPEEQWKADARLISAAPEMLAALQQFISVCDTSPSPISLVREIRTAVDVAKSAAAKATGATK